MIEIKDFCLKIKDNVLIENINLDLNNGVYGLFGENGCGKTTLFKEICGLSNNLSLNEDIYASIETPAFYNFLTGKDNINYFLINYDLKKYNELIKKFKLEKYINKKVFTYSLGMKMKLNIIIVLLSDSKVLLFDETTNSLDFESKKIFYEEIKKYSREKNRTIFFISHDLKELVNTCDEIFLVKNKKIERLYFSKRIKIQFLQSLNNIELLENSVKNNDKEIIVSINDEKEIPNILKYYEKIEPIYCYKVEEIED